MTHRNLLGVQLINFVLQSWAHLPWGLTIKATKFIAWLSNRSFSIIRWRSTIMTCNCKLHDRMMPHDFLPKRKYRLEQEEPSRGQRVPHFGCQPIPAWVPIDAFPQTNGRAESSHATIICISITTSSALSSAETEMDYLWSSVSKWATTCLVDCSQLVRTSLLPFKQVFVSWLDLCLCRRPERKAFLNKPGLYLAWCKVTNKCHCWIPTSAVSIFMANAHIK